MFPNQAEIQREYLNGLFIHNYQPSKAKFLTQKDCPILRKWRFVMFMISQLNIRNQAGLL